MLYDSQIGDPTSYKFTITLPKCVAFGCSIKMLEISDKNLSVSIISDMVSMVDVQEKRDKFIEDIINPTSDVDKNINNTET